jgi:hemolysin III
MRGSLHLAAALAAPFGLVLLLLLADSPNGYVGAAVFASSLMALYTTSASYHIVPWPRRMQGIMKRLDHSMIFVLIAGTYTPFCLLALGLAWGIVMLSVVWSLAALGILLKVLWPSAPRWLGVALYLAVGWLAIVAAAEIVDNLDLAALATLLLGGVLYSIGGIIYALKRPDPFPNVFGFHEVFHVFVIAGSVVHFTLVALFLL